MYILWQSYVLNMFRHVANYHLKLGQLWRCPVSWCTQWKGTSQDCIDHIRLVHSVPITVKAGNLGRWLPPWTVTRDVAYSSQGDCVRGVDGCSLIQAPLRLPRLFRHRSLGCVWVEGVLLWRRSIFSCQSLPTEISFRPDFSLCGSRLRSIRFLPSTQPPSLHASIWMSFRRRIRMQSRAGSQC